MDVGSAPAGDLAARHVFAPLTPVSEVQHVTEPHTAHIDATAPSKSAASWSAIFAGAAVATAVSLILLALGSGLGLATISPWSGHGVSATTFTVAGAIWLIVMQWVSALFGGYIAGRLRTRWVGTHEHEVFFRDTAHGFVTWAVSTLIVAGILAGSVSSLLGAGMHAVAGIASEEGSSRPASGPIDPGTYAVDRLFRPAGAATAGGVAVGGTAVAGGAAAVPGAAVPGTGNANVAGDPRPEAQAIVVNALKAGVVPEADRAYLVDQVEAHTGAGQTDAQMRVDTYVSGAMAEQTKTKAAADAARSAASEASLYTALSMLIGAFIASVAAAVGGRLREHHP